MNDLPLAKVKKLMALWDAGAIPREHEHEVHPDLPRDSRERYLYFTLAPALNFQRQSPALWRAALATWEDPETNYVFFPELVVAAPYEKLRSDLRKHKLSLQENKHTAIWHRLCTTLHRDWHSDPRLLLKTHHYDVPSVIPYLREHKVDFPYLNGGKMANYWLYILHHYTDIPLQNKEQLSIIPDTHVQQCSVHLGLVPAGASPEEVAAAWFTLLQNTGIAPITLHPILWNWSRNNFQPEV